jgi:hypothetical protein
MNTKTSELTWQRVSDGIGGYEYRSSNGARVYQYPRKSFYLPEWGVQLPHEVQGSSGFTSMREARAFVERRFLED